jgi:hypothetical protein
MIVCRRQQRDAMAEADIFGALAARGEENFRRRRMRILFEEVMLDFPHMIDAELVGEFYLIECILEKLELGTFFPGAGQLMFVECSQFHAEEISLQM